jgi:truncated hemoglobin YjbI
VTVLDITTARAEALFASTLSAAEPHDRAVLKAAIAAAVRDYHGVRGCAEQMAAEFGDHPAQAAERMRWARDAARPLAFHQGVPNA